MTLVYAIIAGLIGAFLGFVTAAAAMLAVGSLLEISSFGGALGAAVFATGPIGAAIGLLAGIWLALRQRGHRDLRSLSWRLPAVVLAIGLLGSGIGWYLYDSRPLLGTSETGVPRLDFEIRLPAQREIAAPPSRLPVELSTEQNRMPGLLSDTGLRREGDRVVLTGSVELAYRSNWRLLEVKLAPNEPASIFDLRLPARPSHMRGFGPWRPVDFTAAKGEQPVRAPAVAAPEIRARVVYPVAELDEETRRIPKP